MKFLNDRFLKMPLWVWILVLGGGLGIALRMRHSANAASDTTGTDPNTTDGAGAVDSVGNPYDPSGFVGYPAYTAGLNNATNGIAGTDPFQGITPDLVGVLQDQLTFFEGLQQQTKPTPGADCGPNTKWDAVTQRCIPTVTPVTNRPPAAKVLHPLPPGKKCGTGMRWDYYRGVCTKCGGGQTYQPSTKHCVACPPGYRC